MQSLQIQLPHATNDPRKPLPLGALVPTSGEPALLVVMPTGGKIIFWESLSAATIVDAKRQRQHSVQGTLGSMLSGETVVNITEAEPRGFVLTLSTGRLAHLTITDSQGKPSLSAEYLRSSDSQKAGVFGSLRNVFSSAAWRKDIAAVRASNSLQRGQRFVVAATTSANFQIWDLSWNGTGSLVHEIDAKDEMLKALSEGAEVSLEHKDSQFEFLDFALMPTGATRKELTTSEGNSDCALMALTVLKGRESSRYALVGLTLAGGTISVDVVHPIHCYTDSISVEGSFKPRVLVPEPAQTAFVILEKSVIFVSLLEIEQSPEAQLQIEAHTLPDPFQDVIDFGRSKPYRVVGSASEAQSQVQDAASCIIMIYGFGLIRVSALSMKEGQSAFDRQAVTARTKIEQAIYFGGLRQDLLDFTPRSETKFLIEEVEQAALEISRSILASETPFLPKIGPSMEQNLSRRAQALADLNKYLRRNYPGINKTVSWRLLSNAEKMAAAQALWRCYDDPVQNPFNTTDKKNVFTELCDAAHPKYKTQNKPENYETDPVRHWFIRDIGRLEWAIPYAQRMVETLFKESIEDKKELDLASKARIISEANSIQIDALETAFKFREANAPAYGLQNETMRDGVLQIGYENVPEEVFWTSNAYVVKSVKVLTDIAREFARMLDDPSNEEVVEDDTSEALLFKLAQDNPRQVELCLLTNAERYQWLLVQEDPQTQAEGRARKQAHPVLRQKLLTQLGEIAQTEPAILLAEKYGDMDALADIIENELENNDDEEVEAALQDRIKANFVKFGTPWSNAFFSKHLVGAESIHILNQDAISKKYLTKFLRTHEQAYAKIGWLNEVMVEEEFGRAAVFLEEVQRQSDHLWSHKIAASMRKLSMLAAKSKGQSNEQVVDRTLKSVDQTISTLAIQEKLFSYIKGSVADAIDAEAETDLAVERHGGSLIENKPTFKRKLRHNFEKLLSNQVLPATDLINILTLISVDPLTTDTTSFMPTRSLLALNILNLSPAFTSPSFSASHRSFHERLIWRRCLIADDWPALNRTEHKPDSVIADETHQTLLFQTLYHGFRSGLWESGSQPTTQPLPPNDLLVEVGTSVELLKENPIYKNTPDNQLADLAADMGQEAEQLERCIDAGRLGDRWAGIVEDARLAVRHEADREGERRAECLELE